MFGWTRKSLFRTGKDKHWGAICAFVLSQDEFANLHKLKSVYARFQDELGDSVSHIANGGDIAEQADRARGELIIYTRALGLAKRFLLLSEEKRRALALEYWPGLQLSDEDAIKAANTNCLVLYAQGTCVSMILSDIAEPKKETWWFDYLLLTMADPESPIIELADIAIKTGNGLDRFSEQIARAKTELKMLVAASRDI